MARTQTAKEGAARKVEGVRNVRLKLLMLAALSAVALWCSRGRLMAR